MSPIFELEESDGGVGTYPPGKADMPRKSNPRGESKSHNPATSEHLLNRSLHIAYEACSFNA